MNGSEKVAQTFCAEIGDNTWKADLILICFQHSQGSTQKLIAQIFLVQESQIVDNK